MEIKNIANFLIITLLVLKEVVANESNNFPKGIRTRGLAYPLRNRYGNVRRINTDVGSESRFWPPAQKESRCKYNFLLNIKNLRIYLAYFLIFSFYV